MVHSVRQSKILTARDPITIPPATPIAQAIPAPVPAFIRRPSYWARRTHVTLLRFMSSPPDRASGPYAGVVSPTEHPGGRSDRRSPPPVRPPVPDSRYSPSRDVL